MKKIIYKKLGYGFTALVLGALAVNFFPAVNVYADPADPADPPALVTAPSLEVTTPTSTNITYTIGDDPLVFAGTFEGDDLIITVDNVAIDGADIEIDEGEFSAEIEFDEEGEHTVKVMALAGDEVAAQEFTVTVEDDGEIVVPVETYISKTVNVGEAVEMEVTIIMNAWRPGATFMDEWVPATEEELTIAMATPGKFAITPIKGGRYVIQTSGYKMVEGVLTQEITWLTLTAVDARTEAATTITDIMQSYDELNEMERDADRVCAEVYSSDTLTAAEKEAACRAAYEPVWDAYDQTEMREVNTFGDSAMAFDDAVDAGKALTTKVVTKEMAEADLDENVKDALLDKLDITFASNVKFYNVDVVVYADGEEIGTLKELTNDETVVISGFSGPAAGFKRVFQVVRYHTYIDGYDDNGDPIEKVEVTVIDNVEFDEATGSISFGSDRFSTYLVAYKDVFAPSVDTGVFTGEGGSASSSVVLSVVSVVAVIALAGAFKFAKSARK